MQTTHRSKRSLSLAFLVFALLIFFLSSSVPVFEGTIESNGLYSMGTPSADVKITNVIKFVLEVVAYSL